MTGAQEGGAGEEKVKKEAGQRDEGESELPEGLQDKSQEKAEDEPALPAGLGGASEDEKEGGEPALPAGLGGGKEEGGAEGGPALPEGLGGDEPEMTDGMDSEGEGEDEYGLFAVKDGGWDLTGFWEVRSGYRLQETEFAQDKSIGETRLQLEMQKVTDELTFNVTTDLVYDWAANSQRVNLNEGNGFLDLREANVVGSPFEFMDVVAGRQILTWGTGDLLFLNDMFPKDWQSFFIGRDTEYLKAPSDAIKASVFTDLVNVDVVYTPQFDPDRFVTGDRLTYWTGRRIAGNNAIVDDDRPDNWFEDDEWAVRLKKNVQGYEIAGYGYWGYWKSPGGQNPFTGDATFPRLNVYGASVRGQFAGGIGNAEVAYYDSKDDGDGDDAFVNNSQMRYLLGYSQDLPTIAEDLTLDLQYYVEQTLDYGELRRNMLPGTEPPEEWREVVTVRLTKLFMNQTLTCSLFTYFSPSDRDAYMRPNVHYKVTDELAVEAGGNIFFGDYEHTFFGQFEDNTNLYGAVRYNF
ncbi:hypothetical protein [Anaerohalosphaera lusitana]|uniref:hypothetical protein n=1 Tax=Anaerohalosphaera lusitana TaxID=1936003 RepID=UPI00197C61C8|nr:hypothetical protein [Anaerohalosphaera lusitana]